MILKNIDYVVKNSEHVKINEQKIDDLLTCLSYEKVTNWFNYFKDKFSKEETTLLLFLSNSINFCFWNNHNYKEEYEGISYQSSEAVFVSLIKYFVNNKDKIKISYLKDMTLEEFKNIFNDELFLINERYESFMKTVFVIYKKNNSFYEELFSCDDTKKLLRYIVNEFDNFNDIGVYKKKEVEFHKRAIVLVKDLFFNVLIIRNNLKNIDSLPGCADYNIPRFLYDIGILEYSNDLVTKIKENTQLLHNSDEEIEIRANMIYAIKLICDKLKENNENINMICLDNILWNLSRKNKNSNNHKTISIFY